MKDNTLDNKNILVTGGAGFIGSHLVRELREQGANVTVLDDLSNGQEENVPAEARFVRFRLPGNSLQALLKENNFYGIFHLAGASYVPPSVDRPVEDLQNNAYVTLELLEAVRRHSPQTKIVYTSSAAVYGDPLKLPISEDHLLLPISPYGVSKMAAESYLTVYALMHGLQTASLRFFSVFGPGQRKQVVFDLIEKLHKNPDHIEVHGTGKEIRDFLYVGDAVRAVVLVMVCGKLKGEVYNAAAGIGTSIQELIDVVAFCLKVTPGISYTGKVRPGDPLRWIADISRLKALGFEPMVMVPEGVQNILKWYRSIQG